MDLAEENSEFINPDLYNRLAWFRRGVALPKPDEVVLALLKESKGSLTLVEIAEKTGLPEKKVFKALRKLFGAELIDTENRRYMIRKA
jgi:predicted transcriptional regulator